MSRLPRSGASLLLYLVLGLAPAGAQSSDEASSTPFGFELPENYGAFVAQGGPHRWTAPRQPEGDGQFLILHSLLESAGARAHLVAEYRRKELLQPMFTQIPHKLHPWAGAWGGQQDAAGTQVRFTLQGGVQRGLIERLLVMSDHLILATWEGPASEWTQAEQALASFRLPAEWQPEGRPEFDAERGASPSTEVFEAPGRLDLLIDFGTGNDTFFTVDLRLLPYTPRERAWVWRFPDFDGFELRDKESESAVRRLAPGRIELSPAEDGSFHLRYRLSLEEAFVDKMLAAGVRFGSESLALLDPLWLAWPLPVEGQAFPAPPAWQLRARLPAVHYAVSGSPVIENRLETHEEDDATRLLVFESVAAGEGWPFVLVAKWRQEEHAGRTAWLRLGAKTTQPGSAIRFLDGLSKTLQSWLPAAQTDWAMASFVETDDRTLPGLLLLDEGHGWLRHAVDAEWERGLTRRVGLAQRIANRCFGLQLRGLGSGAAFLEASLSEYVAWRLLQLDGRQSDAEALRKSWVRNEKWSGPLPQPLSLTGAVDLFGPRRLLSRGGLVWQAMERRAGRRELDQILNHFLDRGPYWTTEELRQELERRTQESWQDFFDRHVYGLEPPS